MAGLYLIIWIDPLLFGEKGFLGFSMGLWLEFAFAHAKTAFGIVGSIFPTTKTSGKLVMGCAASFYLLFVGGIS